MDQKITILGKSNVGKSTLFNLLIKKKQSIVAKKENTTININNGILKIKKNTYILIDTAGYTGQNKNIHKEIYKDIYEQTIMSIKESDLILYMVDLISGVNFLDIELLNIINKNNKDLFLLINKIDIKTKIHNIFNILNIRFNYIKFYKISTTHNMGIKKLLNDINIFFKKKYKYKKEKRVNINISILGTPNSGKSTFINTLFLGKKKSIVNKLKGTTIDTLFFRKKYKKYIYTLIDTPGVLKNFKYNKNNQIYLQNIIKIIKESDICVLIIDVSRGINKNENYIKKTILKYKKGIIVIHNKCDLLDRTYLKNYQKYTISKTMKYIPEFFYSLKYNFQKKDLYNIQNLISIIFKNRGKKFNTSFLNNILLEKIKMKNYYINKKMLKIKFCYQKKDKKFPYFVFISNLTKHIPRNYNIFLELLIRKHIYNFYGSPIEIKIKKK